MDAEGEAFRIRRLEIRVKQCLIQGSRIPSLGRGVQRLEVGSRNIGRHGDSSGGGERVRKHHRRVGLRVQHQVVERRVIGDSEAATNDGLVLTEHLSHQAVSPGRRPSEPEARRKVEKTGANQGIRALAERQRGVPNGSCRVALARHCVAVQEIDRLSRIFVPKTQIDGQVGPEFEVVLNVVGLVEFFGFLSGHTGGAVEGRRRVVHIILETRVLELSVDGRQKAQWDVVLNELDTSFERVAAQLFAQVVLKLITIHQPVLGQVGRQSISQEASADGHISDVLGQLAKREGGAAFKKEASLHEAEAELIDQGG